ncbi:hypothetical protein GJU40_13130 [Bacillus lacus]|uniref:Damage-inducible protein DinB n=1 Tax=Metabacillus lacus TaxID=1983721 RepID=A0A7X2LY00_9BACI|nr:DinB family protein [Metabacillus lacus]MRX73085.1 hypothetical protein [Metabacillus lacus]
MNRAEKIVNQFLAHRLVTNELIQKIEEGHYQYQPAPTSMTAQKLVTHMMTSFYKFAQVAKIGNLEPFQSPAEETESNLQELAESYTEKTVNVLRSITDQELDQIIDVSAVFGEKLPAGQLIKMALEHEIHHKGNLFVYVREMGHTELPFYVRKQ